MFMPGMRVRLRKRRIIMVVCRGISDSGLVSCCWYENGKRKRQDFCVEDLMVIEAGYNYLSFT